MDGWTSNSFFKWDQCLFIAYWWLTKHVGSSVVYGALQSISIKTVHSNLFISFSLLGGSALGWFLKWFFDRARPDAIYALTETYGASFPSAHSIYATVLSCLIIFIFHKHAYAKIILFLACLWFLGMGISRVYLGAHYPTDVLVGWSIALVWCHGCTFLPSQISKNKLFLEKKSKRGVE